MLTNICDTILFAQNNHLIDLKSGLFKKYEIDESEEGWLYLKKNGHIKDFAADLTKEKTSLGLTEQDAFKGKNGTEINSFLAQRTDLDSAGAVILKQEHNGRPVEQAEILVHYYENGDAWLMHGRLAKNLPNSNPVLTEDAALKEALNAVNAEKYAWQADEWEQEIKLDRNDPNATWYPKGELIYARLKSNDDYGASNYRLAWEFELRTLMPEENIYQVMVDAVNGKCIRKTSNIHQASGTVHPIYYGITKGFITYYRTLNFDFILKDNVNGTIYTKKAAGGSAWSNYAEVTDQDNIWYENAATSHWAVQQAYKYFNSTFGRKGLNNNNVEIRVMAQTAGSTTGYFYSSANYIRVGTVGATLGDDTALDVLGHEFTHGINKYNIYNSPLGGTGEPGALGESFGDIFGVMVEKYGVAPDGAGSGGYYYLNWEIGEVEPGATVRSLSNPNDLSTLNPGADTYGEPIFWRDPSSTTDNGFIHFNCGVQNYWFFLLSQGGSGTNGIGQTYSVTSIGAEDAAKIAYRNLTVYMTSSSNFAAARAGAINAAKDLFGECSQQYISTINAWHAVGVGSRMDFCAPPISPSSVSYCIEDNYYNTTFTLPNIYPANATVTWIAPANWVFTSSGKTFNLTGINSPVVGTYTLTAKVTSGGNTAYSNATLKIVKCCTTTPCQQARLASKSNDAETSVIKEQPYLNVMPNPASAKLQIEMVLPRKENSIVALLDMSGRIVYKGSLEQNSTIDVSTLPDGLYLLMCSNSLGSFQKKIVIRK